MISRFLVRAILFSLFAGVVVLMIGFVRGWNTAAQFSDGFFYAGALMMCVGALSIMGGNQRSASEPYTHSGEHLSAAERSSLWAIDMLRNYKVVSFLGLSGLLQFLLSGLALLIGKLF